MHLMPSKRRVFTLGLFSAALLFAQDWKTAVTLPAVDFAGLTPAKKNTALRLLRNSNCNCGCDMKLAQCRVEDPQCAWSKGLSGAIVAALKEGKDENAALEFAKTSKWGQAPAPPKLLEDPIKIPIDGSPVQGPANAVVTLVEFSDFQCPYCFKAYRQLNDLLKAYPTQVKLIFKQYPLDSHSQAALAAAAGIAAHRQGKFWLMHDLMFENRQNLSRPSLLALASRAGIDAKRLAADMDTADTKKLVARDIEDGDKSGVTGTPTVYIDGQRYNGAVSVDAMRPIIDAEIKKASGKK